mmetsp:Transcript_111919/g.311544  ORF Transcript_111919/g.311544 Transcript_111919/m.311544 type:complete len:1035 (-) Transcript_111919:79-3183(-)
MWGWVRSRQGSGERPSGILPAPDASFHKPTTSEANSRTNGHELWARIDTVPELSQAEDRSEGLGKGRASPAPAGQELGCNHATTVDAIAAAVVDLIQVRLVGVAMQSTEQIVRAHEERMRGQIREAVLEAIRPGGWQPRGPGKPAAPRAVCKQDQRLAGGKPRSLPQRPVKTEDPPIAHMSEEVPVHRSTSSSAISPAGTFQARKADLWQAMRQLLPPQGSRGDSRAPPALESLEEVRAEGLFIEHRISEPCRVGGGMPLSTRCTARFMLHREASTIQRPVRFPKQAPFVGGISSDGAISENDLETQDSGSIKLVEEDGEGTGSNGEDVFDNGENEGDDIFTQPNAETSAPVAPSRSCKGPIPDGAASSSRGTTPPHCTSVDGTVDDAAWLESGAAEKRRPFPGVGSSSSTHVPGDEGPCETLQCDESLHFQDQCPKTIDNNCSSSSECGPALTPSASSSSAQNCESPRRGAGRHHSAHQLVGAREAQSSADQLSEPVKRAAARHHSAHQLGGIPEVCASRSGHSAPPCRIASTNLSRVFMRESTGSSASGDHLELPHKLTSKHHSMIDLEGDSEVRNPCTGRHAALKEGDAGLMQRVKRRLSEHITGSVDEVQNLRFARETDLLQEIHSPSSALGEFQLDPSDDELLEVGSGDGAVPITPNVLASLTRLSSPFLLRMWGILPWRGPATAAKTGRCRCRCSCCCGQYQRAIKVLAAVAVGACAENLVAAHIAAAGIDRDADWGAPVQLHFQQVTDLVVALGSFLGLLSIRHVMRLHVLGSMKGMLVGYAKRERLLEAWSAASCRQTTLLVLVWALVVMARALAPTPSIVGTSLDTQVHRRLISITVFAFSSGLFLALISCVLHVITLLPMMVDAYCFYFVRRPFLEDNVRDWGLLQAVLRRCSGAVERCFLVLQTTAFTAVLLGVTAMALSNGNHGEHAWLLVAVVLLATVDLRLFFKAAEVTEKCSRVPSLINAQAFGKDVDFERHFLVEYVSYSDAGFYVQDTRLTTAMAIKLTYICGLAAFGVVTKIAAAG